MQKEVLGTDDLDRIASQDYLTKAYIAKWKTETAIDPLTDMFMIAKRLGNTHPDVLALQHKLASAYEAKGRIYEAIQLLEPLAKIRERELGADHPIRLALYHQLARLYNADGQTEEAAKILGELGKPE